MGNNRLPQDRDKLYRKLDEAAQGAEDNGATIGLVHNTAALIRADRTALFNAEKAADDTYAALGAAKTALKNADKALTKWIRKTVSVLKPVLGEAGTAWLPTGIGPNSLDPGPNQAARFTQGERLVLYLTDNAARESAATTPPVTAAHGALLVGNVTSAREALKTARRLHLAAAGALQIADHQARNRLHGLIGELTQLIGPINDLWHDFDLEEPGVLGNPEEPSGLEGETGAPGVLILDWDDAARADYYQVWLQLVGTDTEPHRIPEQFRNSEAILRNLPSGATAKIYVIALNDHGQSTKSDILEIFVP